MGLHQTFNYILRNYYGPRVQKEELGGLKTGLRYQVVLYEFCGLGNPQSNLFDTGSIYHVSYDNNHFWYFKSYYFQTEHRLKELDYEQAWTMKLLGRHWDDPNLN